MRQRSGTPREVRCQDETAPELVGGVQKDVGLLETDEGNDAVDEA